MNIQFVISLLYYILCLSSLDLFCPMQLSVEERLKTADDTLEILEEIYRQLEDLQDEIVAIIQRKLKFVSQALESIEDSIDGQG